ncbi:8-oxoguanine DNA glycosylase protein, partial [Ostertagia ostertagi]
MPILKIPAVELNLKAVLLNGQSFRWRSIGDSFYGVVDGFLLHLRRVDEENIEWSRLGSAANVTEVDIPGKLHDYFQWWQVDFRRGKGGEKIYERMEVDVFFMREGALGFPWMTGDEDYACYVKR